MPAKTNGTSGKVTVLNPFNSPSTPTIDADPKPKACPLCSGFAILFDTNPNVACSVCGYEVWGETIDEALAWWNTPPATEAKHPNKPRRRVSKTVKPAIFQKRPVNQGL